MVGRPITCRPEPRRAVARSATCSGVKPNSSMATSPGAEAPKWSMADGGLGVPLPPEGAGRLDGQTGHAGGQTCALVPLGLDGEQVPRRERDHPGRRCRRRPAVRRRPGTAGPRCLCRPGRPEPGRSPAPGGRRRHGPRPRGPASAVSARTGSSWRERMRAVGPSLLTAMRQAWAVSLASAGRITRSSGMARMAASCSTGWWVGPSWPRPIESWVQE